MDFKMKSISLRLSIAIVFALFFFSCDPPSYYFKFYLSNQTKDTIMFKWFKEKDMNDPHWYVTNCDEQQSLFDTVYVLPPNKKEYISGFNVGSQFFRNENDADTIFEKKLKCISCFGPILFKDGNSIQYSRNCTYPKNFYNAYSFFAREGRTELCFKYIYYVTEEDYQQALNISKQNYNKTIP